MCVVVGCTRTVQKTAYWIKIEKKCFVILAHVCINYSLLCSWDYDVKNLLVQLYRVIRHT